MNEKTRRDFERQDDDDPEFDVAAAKRKELEKYERQERINYGLPGTGKKRSKRTDVKPKKKKRKR